jgi:hypothetical protein
MDQCGFFIQGKLNLIFFFNAIIEIFKFGYKNFRTLVDGLNRENSLNQECQNFKKTLFS